MKRVLCGVFIICTVLSLAGCGGNAKQAVFTATVLENSGTLIVEPPEGSKERSSSDKIAVHTGKAVIQNSEGETIDPAEISVNQKVEITYDGTIAESYPAQLWASKVKVVG
jgi:ABC-type tungstate transport system permease subunit